MLGTKGSVSHWLSTWSVSRVGRTVASSAAENRAEQVLSWPQWGWNAPPSLLCPCRSKAVCYFVLCCWFFSNHTLGDRLVNKKRAGKAISAQKMHFIRHGLKYRGNLDSEARLNRSRGMPTTLTGESHSSQVTVATHWARYQERPGKVGCFKIQANVHFFGTVWSDNFNRPTQYRRSEKEPF